MRLAYVALALATIALGLAVHLYGGALEPSVRDVTGDILWAAMMMWIISVIVPDRTLLFRGTTALAICFAVELSQLYHSPSLDAVRQTTLGQLTLGTGFDVRDLFAYTIGVVGAALVDRTIRPRTG